MAGDEAFAAIPDILNFEPVPRRPHANGWTPEHQRAFIAALAITGSARQAARHVGRAAFGAEQLRTAKGGRSFAAAWDAALDLARDKELARLHDNLGELAKKTEEANAEAKASGRLVAGDDEYGEGDEGSYEQRMDELRERIWDKLQKLRKQELRKVMHDPEQRKAWDIVHGPQDWEGLENGTWKGIAWSESAECKAADASVAGAARRNACPDRPAGRPGLDPGEPNPSGSEADRRSPEAGFTPAKQPSSSASSPPQDKRSPRLRRM